MSHDFTEHKENEDYHLLAYRISVLEKDLALMEQKLRENNARERRQLIAGIMFLGSIITALFSIIWTNLSVILKGNV